MGLFLSNKLSSTWHRQALTWFHLLIFVKWKANSPKERGHTNHHRPVSSRHVSEVKCLHKGPVKYSCRPGFWNFNFQFLLDLLDWFPFHGGESTVKRCQGDRGEKDLVNQNNLCDAQRSPTWKCLPYKCQPLKNDVGMDEAAVDKESSHLFKVDLFQSTLMAYQLLRQVGRWVKGAVRRHTS